MRVILMVFVLFFAVCATGTLIGIEALRGVLAVPLALATVEAETPRLERPGGLNRLITSGRASWFSDETCKGRSECDMASGMDLREAEQHGLSFCANWDSPFGTWLRVTNVRSMRTTLCVVMDRGPHRRLNRILDLSRLAYGRIADKEDWDKGTMLVMVEAVE